MEFRIVDRLRADRAVDRAEVTSGLRASPASVAPKYFYDPLGCALYGAICRLPEYYPTRTEVALFEEKRLEIARAVGVGRQMVDLGAGDCCKARGWLPFLDPSRYIAVDIAAAEIAGALQRLAPDFPAIEMAGVVADFNQGLDVGDLLTDAPVTFFYPGSSIGNFAPLEAVRFLAAVKSHCVARPGSSLLIGVDGKKDPATLVAAYDDALGVTAAFNRNVLRHLNARFGFDFSIDGFSHVARYDDEQGRIEMHLESRRDQAVLLDGVPRRFLPGERIHTENSYKYAPAEFEALLAEAGFRDLRRWDAPAFPYYVFVAA